MAKVEYPQVVYGPGDETVTINEAAEMPDGFMTFKEKYYPESVKKPEKETVAEAKARRAELMAFLDEHNVEYAKNLGTDKLADLADKLEKHLASKTEDGA